MALRSPPIDRAFRRRRAFTIYEALAAGLVLSIVMVGVCDVIAAYTQQTVAGQQSAQAVELARELMDEIASKPLANPSTGLTTVAAAPSAPSGDNPTTTTRSTFVAVGDYNGYVDYSGNLYNLSGTTTNLTGTQEFERSVTVTLGAKPTIDTSSSSNDFALVTVTVNTPSAGQVTLQRVVTNYTFSR